MDKDIGDVIAGMLVFFLILLVVVFVIYCLYLAALGKALSRCSPRNQTMGPGAVWLNLIPLFNMVWIFITVNRVAESLEKEFRSRRLRATGNFGKSVGLCYAGFGLAGIIPLIGPLFSLASFVCWIIHWVQVAGYSGELARGGKGDMYDDDYDDGYDDDDDRPRSRRRDDYDDEDDRPRSRRRDDDDDDYRPRDRR